ncbi:MAG: DUF4286 family protein [Gemmatimonadales bacterium]
MLRYEVTVTVREDLRKRFEEYFTSKHIPEILATGCFLDIRFDRSDAGGYRTVYHAATRADLDRYLTEHTARFRADFLAHFPEGVTPARENWTELRYWMA